MASTGESYTGLASKYSGNASQAIIFVAGAFFFTLFFDDALLKDGEMKKRLTKKENAAGFVPWKMFVMFISGLLGILCALMVHAALSGQVMDLFAPDVLEGRDYFIYSFITFILFVIITLVSAIKSGDKWSSAWDLVKGKAQPKPVDTNKISMTIAKKVKRSIRRSRRRSRSRRGRR